MAGLNTQDVWIEKNLIVPGQANPGAFFSVGNGIMAQEPLGGRFHISKNTVECENPEADGIFISAFGSTGSDAGNSVIEKNRITMHDSLHSAVGLYGSVNRTLISENHIEGSGATALTIGKPIFPDLVSVANLFFHNQINRFESQVADVLLDSNSRETQFRGFCGTLLDYGLDNDIQCLDERIPDNSSALSNVEARQAIMTILLTLKKNHTQ